MSAPRQLLKSTALGLAAACLFAAIAPAAAPPPVHPSATGCAPARDRPTPSGLPVPRFVSLKFDKVNARGGPGDDHQLKFVYRVRGLPVQVVAETSEWRRVRDPEGQVVWVHKRTVEARRTVMNTSPQPVALLRKPKPGASFAGLLNPRALATLDRCEKGWCRIRVEGAAGWVRDGALWGAASETPECH